ncbi:MAG: adenylyltransferase/cytidyltransferase family protein [Rhabdochlamydiaceae bacterium]
MSPFPKNFEEYFKLKWIEPTALVSKVEKLKAQGKKIATLNGSFDLLHAGHLHIIYEASLQGDVLIVALNTDHSIQTYKNLTRPIVSLPYRARMIAALGFVSFVTCFDETDPRAILEKIRPHVHVNGAEYGVECIEADIVKRHGGKIHIVPLIPGLSTSNLIKKIIDSCG